MGRKPQNISSTLREARIAGKKSVSEVANALAVSASYISDVERLKKQPSERYVREFAKLLQLPEETFLEISNKKRSDLADSFVELILATVRFPPEIAKQTFVSPPAGEFRSGAISAGKLPGRIEEMLGRAISTGAKNLFVLWSGQSYGTSKYQELLYEKFLPRLMENRIEFEHIIRQSLAIEHQVRDVASALRALVYEQAWRSQYGFKKRLLNIGTVQSIVSGVFPIDFYISKGTDSQSADAIIALCLDSPFHTETGYGYCGDADNIYSHYSLISAGMTKDIQVFGQFDAAEFTQEFEQADTSQADRDMSQRFFGYHTRPATDYRTGSPWCQRTYQRYLDDNYEPKEAKALTEADRRWRFKGLEAVLNRLKTNGTIRHIHSRQALQYWAQHGERMNRHGLSSKPESPEERIIRIDNIIDMLSRYDGKFLMAVVDDRIGRPLGWKVQVNETNIGWVVHKGESLILEATYQVNPANLFQVQAIVRSKAISELFSTHFERVWNSIPSETWKPNAALQFMSDLRQRVPL